MAIVNNGDEDRFVLVVAKLLELTQQKKLRWEASQLELNPLVASPEKDARNVYVANYELRRLRIFEKYVATQSLRRMPSGERTTINVWRSFLELSEPDGRGWWSFPRMDSISDLMRAVQYQVSGVDDFVSSLLKK